MLTMLIHGSCLPCVVLAGGRHLRAVGKSRNLTWTEQGVCVCVFFGALFVDVISEFYLLIWSK